MEGKCTNDLAIIGGRVVNPSTGIDGLFNVGIRAGRITAITREQVAAHELLDASDMVVAPGFIDFHVHRQDDMSRMMRALDGVTTVLDLEEGVFPVSDWYDSIRQGTAVNCGASASHKWIRISVMGDEERGLHSPSSRAEEEMICAEVRRSLREGALAIGYGLEYTPGATTEEVRRLFSLGADLGALNVVHLRSSSQLPPNDCSEALDEVISICKETGAAAHVSHINSSGRDRAPDLLLKLGAARETGVDITTETYPYTAASTNIRAAIFREGWRERLGIDYSDLEWVATGERLTGETFARRRKEGGMVVAHIIPEHIVEKILVEPGVLIVSDALPFDGGRAHPRAAGAFARVLGTYVRERGVLSLMEAVKKMSLLPAERLAPRVPAMQRKGRLEVGADADICVFDPVTVGSDATFSHPLAPSTGIEYVIVNGVKIVTSGKYVHGSRPGAAIRRPRYLARIP